MGEEGEQPGSGVVGRREGEWVEVKTEMRDPKSTPPILSNRQNGPRAAPYFKLAEKETDVGLKVREQVSGAGRDKMGFLAYVSRS